MLYFFSFFYFTSFNVQFFLILFLHYRDLFKEIGHSCWRIQIQRDIYLFEKIYVQIFYLTCQIICQNYL